jgi:hypothetical protein
MSFVRQNPLAVIFLFLMLVLCVATLGFASSRAGRVVSDVEATELAIPTATTEIDLSAQAEFQVGDPAVVFGGSYGALVPLFSGPGARTFSSQVLNNTAVTILALGLDPDGVTIWYQVQALAGTGWLTGENLNPPQ